MCFEDRYSKKKWFKFVDYLMVLYFILLMYYVVMVDYSMNDEKFLYFILFVINVLYIFINIIND